MSSRGSTDYSCPKIPLVYVFNATLFTNYAMKMFAAMFTLQPKHRKQLCSIFLHYVVLNIHAILESLKLSKLWVCDTFKCS